MAAAPGQPAGRRALTHPTPHPDGGTRPRTNTLPAWRAHRLIAERRRAPPGVVSQRIATALVNCGTEDGAQPAFITASGWRGDTSGAWPPRLGQSQVRTCASPCGGPAGARAGRRPTLGGGDLAAAGPSRELRPLPPPPPLSRTPRGEREANPVPLPASLPAHKRSRPPPPARDDPAPTDDGAPVSRFTITTLLVRSRSAARSTVATSRPG